MKPADPCFEYNAALYKLGIWKEMEHKLQECIWLGTGRGTAGFFFQENLQLHNVPSFPFLPASFYQGSMGITPEKYFGTRDGRRWVILEHFGHTNQHTIMNQVFKWCLLFHDLWLILTMFPGCCSLACMTRRPNVSLLNYSIHFYFLTHCKWWQLHKFLFTTIFTTAH